jgi:hypothetical protein
MADIEERCAAAMAAHIAQLPESVKGDFYFNEAQEAAAFEAGYMAGVAQTQHDYSEHYRQTGRL